MKQLAVLLTVFIATEASAQQTSTATQNVKIDTVDKPKLQVEYVYKKKPVEQPAFFVNGTFIMNNGLLSSINPDQIESINVIKKDTLLNKVQYSGQVFILTKNTYSPQFISLTDLKNKYTDFKGKAVLFFIDENVIDANYDQYMVDENYLLTIIVDKIFIDGENKELGIIKLLTQSAENIKSRNRIIIRGTAVSKG